MRRAASRWVSAGLTALLALSGLGPSPAAAGEVAGEVAVAVASNFLQPLRRLAPAFEAESGHRLVISAGSTGKLYAQIRQGAPYDVFLAANAREPERLEREGETVAGARFTYALGRLAFWTAAEGGDPEAMLQSGAYDRVAIANPKLAPYGRAAQQALSALGAEAGPDRLIAAETVSQALQFAESGNVDIAALAHAQILAGGLEGRGGLFLPAPALYDPIRQQAVLLKRGAENPAARAFLAFLQSDGARAAIRGFGYDAAEREAAQTDPAPTNPVKTTLKETDPTGAPALSEGS